LTGWLRCLLVLALYSACGENAEPVGSARNSVGGTHGGGASTSQAGGAEAKAGAGSDAGAGAGAGGTAGVGGAAGAGGVAAAGAPDDLGDSGAAGGASEPDPPVLTGLEETDPYPESVYPAENPYSAEKALLGKILFWEEQLSSHDTHACGTCHRPAAGGSDPRSALGAGPNGVFGDEDDARSSPGVVRCDSTGAPKADPVYGLTVQVAPRKAPSAMDAWFFDELFWDGRARSAFTDPVTGEIAIQSGGALESQAAGPPVSTVEMSCEGYGWTDIESKLSTAEPLKLARQIPRAMLDAISQHPSYAALFDWVYGTPEITARRILFAIATYERQLRSNQTPWDRFNAGDTGALTDNQQAGLALFNIKARCAKCHVPPLFTDNEFHDIGAREPDLDPGRSSVSGDAADRGKMKTPSLRNVGLRAPGGLLHFATGTGASLRSVLDVYRQGGLFHDNIDPEIHSLNMPEFEFEQLLEFVQQGLTDPRAAAELPPFDRPRLASEE
jgi:cytochrome c peroxidase